MTVFPQQLKATGSLPRRRSPDRSSDVAWSTASLLGELTTAADDMTHLLLLPLSLQCAVDTDCRRPVKMCELVAPEQFQPN